MYVNDIAIYQKCYLFLTSPWRETHSHGPPMCSTLASFSTRDSLDLQILHQNGDRFLLPTSKKSIQDSLPFFLQKSLILFLSNYLCSQTKKNEPKESQEKLGHRFYRKAFMEKTVLTAMIKKVFERCY